MIHPGQPTGPTQTNLTRLITVDRELLTCFYSGRPGDRRFVIFTLLGHLLLCVLCVIGAIFIAGHDQIPLRWGWTIRADTDPFQYWSWVLMPLAIGSIALLPVLRFAVAIRRGERARIPGQRNRAERRAAAKAGRVRRS